MKRSVLLLKLTAVALMLFLTITGSQAQTYQWKSLPMGGAGFVSGLITSKQEQNLMYCRTDVGGAYKWNVADSSWKPLLDWASATQSGFYGVESIAIDPHATNKLYLYVGINYFDNGKTAILKSDDYGQTFTTIDVTSQFKAHGNGMGRNNGERLQVDPNLGSTLYVGTRYNGLFKSIDAGLTWNRLNGLNITTTPNGNGISFITIDSTSGSNGVASQKIYVGVSRYDTITTGVYQPNLYVSTDAGSTFTPVTGGPTGYMPQRAKLLGNGDMIINYANGSGPYGTTFTGSNEPMSNGGIWKYSTSSSTWTNITPSGIARAWGGITVDPNNPSRMMASTINNYQFQYSSSFGDAYGDRIYLTSNGGTTWTDVVSRGFTVDPAGTWVLGGAIHWAGSIEFDPFNTNKVYITSGNGVFSNSNIDNAATQWKFEVKGLEETVPTDIVSIPGGALYTTIGDYDGFKHTSLNQYGIRHNPRIGTNTGITAATAAPNKLVRVGSSMYISTDGGTTWTKTTAALPTGSTTPGTQGKVTISADGTTIFYCPSGASLTYYSTNDGASWTACPPSISNAYPVADKVNSKKVYIYNNGSGNLNRSYNAGISFTTTNIGSGGNKFIRTIPGQEGHIWAALYTSGLKRSVDSGVTFTTIAGVTACSAIGYGKAAPGATYLTLYMWGTVGGVTGIFKSINEGASWTRVNDDAHQFGGPGNAQFVMGDMNVYDVVYMSTVGRGVIAGVGPGSGLPISLTSFNVREQTQNGITIAQLTWKTATESNANYYGIERSTDSRNWSTISSVASKAVNGNSNIPLTYNYADDVSRLTGTIYYRLKMADKNGSFTYSSIGSINLGKKENLFTVSVLPNPLVARQNAIVRFTSDKDQDVLLKLVSATGAIIYNKSIALPAGNTNVTLPEIANQPSGMYSIQVISKENNHKVATAKFIVQ